MAGRAALRASDADRERVAERLHRAATEGRLLTEELEQRLEASFSARTYAQLDAVLADLPGRRISPARAGTLARVPPALVVAIAVPIAILILIAVVLVLTGVFAGWMLWLLAGWWFFGRHRRRLHAARHGRSLHACGGWQTPYRRV
jgi:Flp pilus assembly protein TadB